MDKAPRTRPAASAIWLWTMEDTYALAMFEAMFEAMSEAMPAGPRSQNPGVNYTSDNCLPGDYVIAGQAPPKFAPYLIRAS